MPGGNPKMCKVGLGFTFAGLSFTLAGLGFTLTGMGLTLAGLGFTLAVLGSTLAGLGSTLAGLGFTLVWLGYGAACRRGLFAVPRKSHLEGRQKLSTKRDQTKMKFKVSGARVAQGPYLDFLVGWASRLLVLGINAWGRASHL